jgi:hypothetical protein
MVGRKKIVLTEKNQKVVNEYLSKKINSKEASKRLNIGGSTFFRLVAEFRANSGLEPFYIGRGGRKPGQKKTGSKTVSLKTQDEFFEPTLLEKEKTGKTKIKFFEKSTNKMQNAEVCTENGLLSIYNKKGELLFLAAREMFLTKEEVILFCQRAGINEELEIIFDFDPKKLIGTEKEGYYVKFYDAELDKLYCTKEKKVFVVSPSFFM